MEELKKLEDYLKILDKQFESFNINKRESLISVIKNQMLAIIKHWNDKVLRNLILFFAYEEASFYIPDAHIDIKAFVVASIRNSLLETAGSKFYSTYGFNKRLDDEKDFPVITKRAITFFKEFNFEKACEELKNVETPDYYYEALEKYPLTNAILTKVVTTKKLETYFDKIEVEKVKIDFQTSEDYSYNEEYVVEDGYSAKFNQILLDVLERSISSHKKIFFVESFKYLSRNFEKNLKTMEYLLQNDVSFVTFNYYISNGFISRRKEFLRPSHDESKVPLKFKEQQGLSKKHKNALEAAKNQN